MKSEMHEQVGKHLKTNNGKQKCIIETMNNLQNHQTNLQVNSYFI